MVLCSLYREILEPQGLLVLPEHEELQDHLGLLDLRETQGNVESLYDHDK